MKNPFKVLISFLLGVGPALTVIYFWYFRLCAYIVSVIPAGEWHALFGVIVYVAMTFVGGFELIAISFWLGCVFAAVFFGVTESSAYDKSKARRKRLGL